MASRCRIAISVGLLFLSAVSPAFPFLEANITFGSSKEIRKYRRIQSRLIWLNKPSLRTFQACSISPDGDIIDCVPSHLQPAFDHPLLKGQTPLDPPERPRGHWRTDFAEEESFQLWRITGEFCPEETIPIRRTREEDILRANSHAVGYVSGDQYFGAKGSLNVWAPNVKSSSEFSLSQIWVISGSFGEDLNTIEAGWQTDAYQATGCYNLLCSGFVQTNNRIAIGAAIRPTSAYAGGQYDISVLIWKDPNHGNWWLELGAGELVGYWPSLLFSHLADHASMLQFGGEVVNTEPSGFHTSTEMGSGHFAGEGFGRASYFRNLQLVDWDNSLVPVAGLRLLADRPGCYDIQGGVNGVWGNYFYYGGPGRNTRCP
ncbi:hypothetical protein AXF42_Ash008541 [Apostasia shenzhenica]|uniref:Neprosin PEP catalytic domain-containing protein n=1 Tax=Apostasia shenzhenica TaxID=1088818 RepID=A0A2I0B1N9_9ASPA|nr:hypothetical protein AXF42_Ash008541 [Apostasia shenzhenica]